MGKTLADKVWEDHVVHRATGEPDLIYIDLHLIHEVTSPQAFDGLRLAGRKVRRPDLTIATEDHNTPTIDIDKPIADPVSKIQVDTLRKNAKDFGIRIHSLGDVEQGIVHVVGPRNLQWTALCRWHQCLGHNPKCLSTLWSCRQKNSFCWDRFLASSQGPCPRCECLGQGSFRERR